jgi:hypothetical protein
MSDIPCVGVGVVCCEDNNPGTLRDFNKLSTFDRIVGSAPLGNAACGVHMMYIIIIEVHG